MSRDTVFFTPYKELTPLKGYLWVAMHEDGEVLGTSYHETPEGPPKRLKSRCARVVGGFESTVVAPDAREGHTNFQITLGLHQEKHAPTQ